MSQNNYNKAKELIEKNRSQCFFAGEKDNLLIEKAEKVLEISFSQQLRDFFKTYGAGSIGSEEIYGIINDNFTDASVPNGVWFTLTERKEIQMPKNLYVISDTGADEFYCLDFSKSNEYGEPPVVIFVPGVDNNSQTYEIIAEDLGDYLLEIVEQEVI